MSKERLDMEWFDYRAREAKEAKGAKRAKEAKRAKRNKKNTKEPRYSGKHFSNPLWLITSNDDRTFTLILAEGERN